MNIFSTKYTATRAVFAFAVAALLPLGQEALAKVCAAYPGSEPQTANNSISCTTGSLVYARGTYAYYKIASSRPMSAASFYLKDANSSTDITLYTRTFYYRQGSTKTTATGSYRTPTTAQKNIKVVGRSYYSSAVTSANSAVVTLSYSPL